MGIRSLDHVLVLSDDLDVSRAFYCDALGLEAGPRPPLEFPGHWLYVAGDPVARLHLADRSAYLRHAAGIGLRALAAGTDAPVAPPTVDHVSFDADDFDAILHRIEAHGLAVVHNDVPGVQRQLFLRDPNGVLVEINVKRADG